MPSEKEYVKLWMSYADYFEPLGDAEVGRLARAMIAYKSTGATPKFSGNERFTWPAIKRDIDEQIAAQAEFSEKQSENGKKGGRPKKPRPLTENPKNPDLFSETQKSQGQRTRTKDKDKGHITPLTPLDGGGFGPELQKALEDWLAYKAEKNQAYKPQGLQSLIAQIRKHADQCGERAVAELIAECMASNWQGIIFDRLKTVQQVRDRAQTPIGIRKSFSQIIAEREGGS